MSKNHRYPHLVIKEGDIQNVIYEPKGRTKPVARNFTQHGQLLLEGMDKIISIHNSCEHSLDTDKMSFSVKLNESQKFQDKARQDFLETNNIHINVIKNKTTAIATAKKDDFEKFKKKVVNYRTENRNVSEFQFIDAIEPIEAKEKLSTNLQNIINDENQKKQVFDLQMVLLPNLSDEEYVQSMEKFKSKIEKINGKFARKPYRLTNGMVITRFELQAEYFDYISEDDIAYRIEETGLYSFEPSEIKLLECDIIKIDNSIEPSSLPSVVVIDGGIDFSKRRELIPFVKSSTNYSVNQHNNFEHGTSVAARVIFGEDIDVQVKTGMLIPKAQVIDACVFDEEMLSEDALIEKIRFIVETYHDTAKIYNLSVNKTEKIDQTSMSLLAYEIDALVQKYNILFINSSGNHNLWQHAEDISEIIEDDDALIASPAESILTLTVGAVNNQTDPNSLTRLNEIAPYSRIGHGFAQNEKPDLVAYGGNLSVQNRTNFGITTISNSGQFVSTSGTSYAAPAIASHAAQVMSFIGGNNENSYLLTKLLLLHSAEPLIEIEGANEDELNYHKKLYGNGLCNIENALYSDEHKVTFICTGTLNRLNKQRVKFYMPQIVSQTSKKNPFFVKITCLSNPPVDVTKGEEYLGAYVNASLHKLGDKGDMSTCNPSKIQTGRKKWQPWQHFKKSFCKTNPGDWELWLQLWTRWDVEDDFEVPYSLAITIEDPLGNMELYSSIQSEVQTRYDLLIRPETRIQT